MIRSSRYDEIIARKDYPVKGAVMPPTINKRQGMNKIPAAPSSKKSNDCDNNRTATRQSHNVATTSYGCIVYQGALHSSHQLGTGNLLPIYSTGVRTQ